MRCVNCGWDNSPNAITCEKCGLPLSTYGEPSHVGGGQQSPYQQERLSDGRNPRPTVVNGGGTGMPPKPTRMMGTGDNYTVPQQRATVLQTSCSCSRCGYLVMGGQSSCPNCGTALVAHIETPSMVPPKSIRKMGSDQKVKCQKCNAEVGLDFLFCPHCGERIRQQTIAVWHHRKQEAPIPRCSLTIIPEEDEQMKEVTREYEGHSIILNRNNTEERNRTITSSEQAELIHEEGKWYILNHSELESTLIQVTRKMELQSGDIVVLGDRRFKFNSEPVDGE